MEVDDSQRRGGAGAAIDPGLDFRLIRRPLKKEGAPFMSSQDKWVDQIIGKSILDAVNDPSINYLTFPDDIGAIAKVT